MQQKNVEQLFSICLPLMKRLGLEDYDYQFIPTDLEIIPSIKQLEMFLADCSKQEYEVVTATFDIAAYELEWLITFHDMSEMLLQEVTGTVSDGYYPFRKRLDALERGIQDSIACGIIRGVDDGDLLLLAQAALEHPIYLALAEKLLSQIDGEMGGEPGPELTRTDYIMLYEFRLQILKYGFFSVCPTDYRKPSRVVREQWLFAQRKEQVCTEYPPERLGNWIIFCSYEDVDSVWKRIARATSLCQLGIAAKVSTAKKKTTRHTHDFVMYIYTQDSADRQDIFRVRSQLRTLGITQEIVYRQVHSSSKHLKNEGLYVD